MPENVCHEGNYGIVGQLFAGRADEAYALKAAQSEADQRVPQLGNETANEEWMERTSADEASAAGYLAARFRRWFIEDRFIGSPRQRSQGR